MTADREIISFGGRVKDVGGLEPSEVVITLPGGADVKLSGIPPTMAKEFGLHLFETVYFSISVRK